MARYPNPFELLADLLRGLRQNVVFELGLQTDSRLLTPRVGELLGALAGLINDCEDLRAQLDLLETKDPTTFAAFERALEKQCPTTPVVKS